MPPLVRPCFVRTKSSIHEKYEKWAKIPEMLTRSKLSSVVKIKLTEDAVWADWAIYCTLGNFSKPVATIFLLRSPTFFGNFFVKGVKIFRFSSEIILGNFYRHLTIFYWSRWSEESTNDKSRRWTSKLRDNHLQNIRTRVDEKIRSERLMRFTRAAA